MGELLSGRGCYTVKWSMWWGECVCAWVCVCTFCPASCFLMQHRTASPGLLGDLVMDFFLPVLAGNENQLLCCCHRSGEVCFLSASTTGTSPSTVTLETRATPTLFPSMSLPSMIYRCFLFLIYHTAPAYQHFRGQSSVQNILGHLWGGRSAEASCWRTAHTIAPELLSCMPVMQK